MTPSLTYYQPTGTTCARCVKFRVEQHPYICARGARVMNRYQVCLCVALVYGSFLNILLMYNYTLTFRRHGESKRVIYQLPETNTTSSTLACGVWSHATLILAPTETHPISNDPSEAVRALAPVKRMLKRLVSGKAFLAVSHESYMPSHKAWCDRLGSETSNHVTCALVLADNSTLPSAVEALRQVQPCLAAILVITDPSAVDSGLLRRLSLVSYSHYSCLALTSNEQSCPVFLMPLR